MSATVAIGDVLARFVQNPDLHDFAKRQFDRGIDYYRRRVARLGLRGTLALDAGCGVGNWAIALAGRFESVYALENRGDRLAVLAALLEPLQLKNIELCLGSIERLPFPDHTFDTIFCNGVVFLVDYRKALSEFGRTLRPGGCLYLTWASPEWSKHLILERGKHDPMNVIFGCDGLLNRWFAGLDRVELAKLRSRMGAFDLKAELAAAAYLPIGRLPHAVDARGDEARWYEAPESMKSLRSRLADAALRLMFDQVAVRNWQTSDRIATRIAQYMEVIRRFLATTQSVIDRPEDIARSIELLACLRFISGYGSPTQRLRLVQDFLARVILGTPTYRIETQTHCQSMQEIVSILREHGLDVAGASWEGTLVVDPKTEPITPIYEPSQGVFEYLAFRPAEASQRALVPQLQFFRENARRAAMAYGAFQRDVLLCNRMTEDCSEVLVSRQIRENVRDIPRESFLADLVDTVTAGAIDAQTRLEKIYRFIQDALFHHPTFQLLRDDFDMERDPVTVLFAGIGRCGHIAAVSVELLRRAGFEARVTQLHAHVSAEVVLAGRWLLFDADLFKGGIYPTNRNGQWLGLEELREQPALIDHVPAIGTVLSREGPWMVNAHGRVSTGYVDSGLPWERPYSSYIYFGGTLRFPPAPALLRWNPSSRILSMQEPDGTWPARQYRIVLHSRGRGWTYRDYPDVRLLQHPHPDIGDITVSPAELARGVSIPQSDAPVLASTYALDDYMLADPKVARWPGEELALEISP